MTARLNTHLGTEYTYSMIGQPVSLFQKRLINVISLKKKNALSRSPVKIRDRTHGPSATGKMKQVKAKIAVNEQKWVDGHQIIGS